MENKGGYDWIVPDTISNTLRIRVSDLANAKGVTLAFETGQETADLLRLTLDE